MTQAAPIKGPEYDKLRPETKSPWLDFRMGGITGTEIRDWGNPTKRRAILHEKVTGERDLDRDRRLPTGFTLDDYATHGNRREVILGEWVQAHFGIEPCSAVYAHPQNTRHLASPDGISLDPFTRELIVGTDDAVLCEIKTATKDLSPGKIDAANVLVQVNPKSVFAEKNYYTQMQWQMYVMNAVRTLFVWEQHDGKIDPETGTFTPLGPPQHVWVPRDQALIDVLVEKVAPAALAEIDAARKATTADGLPPAGAIPAEHAILMADYFKSIEAEKTAAAAKKKAWDALKAEYVGKDKPDLSMTTPGLGKLTVSTTEKIVDEFDEERARTKAPKSYEQIERKRAQIEKLTAEVAAFERKYSTKIPVREQRLTLTADKKGTMK